MTENIVKNITKWVKEWLREGGMADIKSALRLYFILAVLLIFITEAGYYLSGDALASGNGNETNMSDGLNNFKPYQFSDKGNGVITIYLKNYTANISLDNFDAIDSGVSELKSKCNMSSRVPLIWNGTTVGYSVDVIGTCNLNQVKGK
jgi:hypothetical protein